MRQKHEVLRQQALRLASELGVAMSTQTRLAERSAMLREDLRAVWLEQRRLAKQRKSGV